ncbi:MAG: SelB C-terminal domain-containing protein [Actinomycetota bacterium]|nr:SelB C-terminal domain-containing protein [Actinomycetota bacterium]
MRVIATAGHVDHGKSTLVRCLTGMEPDRWAEERRRGMTIDLGYAWTSLPSGAPPAGQQPPGQQLAFVDVPGHERFIANMLAGIGPAAAVLFVVAADEGWCVQSREHLAAINALQLRHGVLAVTRCDLAGPEPARRVALDRLNASSLGAVESVAVSPLTGAGIDDLRGALGRLARQIPEPDAGAHVRLWIDRAFTVQGTGTVVTGTLGEGTLAVGDTLELRGTPVSVRGLQSLGAIRDRVSGPARVAVNLRGVARKEVARGDVLLAPLGSWHHTDTVDVRLAPAGQLPTELVLHVGTAAVPVRVRPLGGDVARLTCSRQLPLRTGDRGVLRDPGQHRIAAGVVVLDADPPQLHRRGSAAARAGELAGADGHLDAMVEVTRRGAMSRDRLAALGGGPPDGVRTIGEWLIAQHQWERWVAGVSEAAAAWARRSPLDPDMPLATLARDLALPDAALVPSLVAAAGLPARNGRIIATAAPCLGRAANAVRAVQERLLSAPFASPETHELAALGLTRGVLAAAEKSELLLRVTDHVVLLPSAPGEALRRLRTLPQPFTTSQARTALDSTRRVVIPLLEYLDAHGWTQREGNVRRVCREGAADHPEVSRCGPESMT